WIVDSALFILAIAVGVAALAESWPDHSTFELIVDLALGGAACLSLWVRRSRPDAVGVFAVTAGAVSGLAGGAAVLAVFNVAVRGSRRSLIGVAALSLVSITVYPLLYPSAGAFFTQLVVGLLILVVAIGWGLFARVRRELVLSLRERADRLESEQRLHVERARGGERRREPTEEAR